MTIRGIIWAVLLALPDPQRRRTLRRVSVHGVWSAMSIDLRQDTVLSCVYCAMPVLCFPVFLLVRPAQPFHISAFSDGPDVSSAHIPLSTGAPVPNWAIARV